MKLYSLGQHSEYPQLTVSIQPFNVDGIVLTAEEESLSPEERDLLMLYQRYGRPVGADLEALEKAPRTNYQAINCSFYDHFEAAIVTRKIVALEYLLPDGSPTKKSTRLRDLKTHLTEEYVQLDGGEWIRLDRIVAVDGEAAGKSCSF